MIIVISLHLLQLIEDKKLRRQRTHRQTNISDLALNSPDHLRAPEDRGRKRARRSHIKPDLVVATVLTLVRSHLCL